MKNQRNPFLITLPFFLSGILLAFYFKIVIHQLLYFLIFLLVLMVILRKKILYSTHYLGFLLMLFSFIFGVFIVSFHNEKKPNISLNDEFYQGIIVEVPQEKDKSIKTIVKIIQIKKNGTWQDYRAKSLIYFQKDSTVQNIQYGTRIVFKCKLNYIENGGNPYEFNYQKYMLLQKIFTTAYIKTNQWQILEQNKGNWLKATAIKIRNKLLSIYERFKIDGQEFAILSALTLGYRDEINTNVNQIFSNTGTMHILSVSGLHVGIIFVILNYALKFMNKRKHLFILKSIIIIAMLWLFALIAGLCASVNRSALMFTLIVIAGIIQRKTSTYNIIAASILMLLSINPYYIFDVGFQLSYLAVIAIIALQPKVHALFKVKNKLLEKIWSLTSVSIAAQLGTMPISFYYFHQFPNYFFISNIFAIPLATIILYVAVFLLAINWIPILSNIVAFILKLTVKSLLLSLKFVAFMPFSTTKNIYFNVPELLLMYAAIILFFIYIYKNKIYLLYSTFVSILIFFTLEVFYSYRKINENILVIYNAKNNLIFNTINHKENIVLAENPFDSLAFKNICHQLWMVERKNQPQIKNLNFAENLKLSDDILYKNNFLKIGNITFYIVDDNQINFLETKNKINVDYIVLSNSTIIKVDVLKNLFNFKEFIIASDNKLSYVNKIKKILDKNKIKYFDINTQGALVLDYYTKQKKRL